MNLQTAVSSILVYFAYNHLVFDGIIPVSGAIKQWNSQQVWDRAGGYDLVQNLKSSVPFWPLNNELLVSLEVCAYLLLVGGSWTIPGAAKLGSCGYGWWAYSASLLAIWPSLYNLRFWPFPPMHTLPGIMFQGTL